MSGSASKLQREIKQAKPFRSARQEAFLSLLRTADILRRRMTRLLEPFDVTVQQYNVLRILRGAGPAGLPTLSIGERLIEETPGMTRLLDRLDAKGLVRRERCVNDRRQVLCYLTQAGFDLLASIDPVVNNSENELVSGLSESETANLIRSLDQVRNAIEE